MTDRIKVIHYGLGPIGIETAKLVMTKESMEIVGAVDIAPEMVGKDLGRVLLLEKDLGIIIGNAQEVFKKNRGDVVIHTAGSRISGIFSQLEEIIKAGYNIVSSSEELLYPMGENAEFAGKLHKLAAEKGVTILGTGVNPGFVMDALPLFLTTVCQQVHEVRVERVVNAATRRYPLQKKVGAGMSPDEFRERINKKQLGHVGLLESLYLVAGKLGLDIDKVTENIEPVISNNRQKTAYFELNPGDVAGIKHVAAGTINGREVVNLDLRMYIGAEDPHDEIWIKGVPDIHVRIEGGVAGDQATAAVLVNSIPAVLDAKPGLMTVKDLRSPHFLR